MNKFPLNVRNLSQAISTRLVDIHSVELPYIVPDLVRDFRELEAHRARMAYNTGSISLAAGVFLYMVANVFKPRVIVEVGTFLGKSTWSLARGADWGESAERHLYTADKDNPCCLPEKIGNVHIHPHPGKTGTEMFTGLIQAGIKADLLSIDGRLQPDDLPLIRDLIHPETVILLDDFEGVEKGVSNLQLLTPLLGPYIALPPVQEPRLVHLGVIGTHTTAMLLPSVLLSLTRQ